MEEKKNMQIYRFHQTITRLRDGKGWRRTTLGLYAVIVKIVITLNGIHDGPPSSRVLTVRLWAHTGSGTPDDHNESSRNDIISSLSVFGHSGSQRQILYLKSRPSHRSPRMFLKPSYTTPKSEIAFKITPTSVLVKNY